MTTNAYSFLPWLRQGIATQISAGPGASRRATVPVKLHLSGAAVSGDDPVTRDVEQLVQLFGPGDVIGVDPRAIVRTEPRDWSTEFEPNFLPFIEFYDEDFPWRYSPAAPDAQKKRLQPWLALVVLAAPDGQAEFTDAGTAPGRPLPTIQVRDLGVLPPVGQLAAWVHVHVNAGITAAETEFVSENMPAVLPRLQSVLTRNPDLACSRLICPRRLAPDTPYHAFLVPSFETGRLAGLGMDPAGAPSALTGSWDPYDGRPEPGSLPYYHRWFFRTGATGDFEHLVRLLQPHEVGAEVGNRDMDVQRPGADLPGITTDPLLGGTLWLGGALKVPRINLTEAEKAKADRYENWDVPYPHPFQKALAALINLADDYAARPVAEAHGGFHAAADLPVAEPADPDPVITPPLYGRWHALTSRLLTDRDGVPLDPGLDPLAPEPNWVHELNLDPRFRVAASLGARVMQERQEEFMAAAWAQVGEILEVNRRIRAAQLAREVGHVLHRRHLEGANAVAPGKAVMVTGPAQSRVTTTTVSALTDDEDGTVRDTPTPLAVGYQVARSQSASSPLSGAMRRAVRPGTRIFRALFGPDSGATRDTPPPNPNDLLERMNAATNPATAARPKHAPDALVTLERVDRVIHPPLGIAEPPPSTQADQDPVTLPESKDFRLTLPGDDFVPTVAPPDTPEAQRYKAGLREILWAFAAAKSSSVAPSRPRLKVPALSADTLKAMRSDRTVTQRFERSVYLPPRFDTHKQRLIEAMAYPVIDLPMYKPLLDLSPDLFLPNVNLIPPNTVALLETNQRFIESYLVGLNHEMARELLWREYPTDQRGTPFRQFWDVRTVLPVQGESPAARRERLYDIPPIHRWPPLSTLGSHDNRETGEANEEELILVIRGELLKRYPTAVIYAHKARWQPSNANPDLSKERVLDPAGVADPTSATVLLPLYEARIEPDVFLFGFDLTKEKALGGQGTPPDPGWFFVIKERPGEPRFGLDIEHSAPAGTWHIWNDLAWPDVTRPGDRYIPLGDGTPSISLTEPDPSGPDQEKHPQWTEDKALPRWHADLSAADVAYMTFQAPVLVAVHAAEMLGD